MKFLARFVSVLVMCLGFNAMAQRGYPIYPNEMPYIRFTPSNSVTLASDAFARSNFSYVLVSGEGGVSDNLATITGGRMGDVLWIIPADPAQIITIKNGTGNILTGSGADYSIPASGGSVMVMYNGTNWMAYLPIGTSGPGSGDVVGPVGVTADSDIAIYSGTTGKIIKDSKASIDTNGVITSGIAGADGGLKMYSEQGATDYTVAIYPNAAMTSDANFYLPADEAAAESWLTMGTDGVIDYTAISTETLAAVTARGASTATLTTLTGGLTLGADDDPSNLILHSASSITMYDDSDDTSVIIGPVEDGTTTLPLQGELKIVHATATDDKLTISVAAGGAASIIGNLTTADLTSSGKTWTLPDASGYVVVDDKVCSDIEGTGLTITAGTLNVDDAYLLNNGDTGTGNYDFTGAILLGATPLVLEGATDDDYQLNIAVTDITGADKTATFQNASGTVVLHSAAVTDVAGDHLSVGTTTLNVDDDWVDETGDTMTGSLILDNTGTTVDSPSLSFRGDITTTELEATIFLAQAADPYLRISVDDDSATPALTPVLDVHDTVIAMVTDNTVDIGATGANRPKALYLSGGVYAEGGTIQAGATAVAGTITAMDAGTLVFNDDGNNTSVTFGPVGDGTTILPVTGTINATGLQVGGSAVLTAEADTLAAVTGRGATTSTASTFEGNITVGKAGGTTGQIQFVGTTSGAVITKVADTAGTWTMTLPANDGDANQFLQTDGSGVCTWATASTSPTGFTAALNTASPNGTNNVSSLTASGGTTNQFAAFIPKGTGGILAAIPDGAATGGNARGAYAIDLQTYRSAAANVASGDNSILICANDGKASGLQSGVFGGEGGIASGIRATVLGGDYGTASGANSVSLGGELGIAAHAGEIATGSGDGKSQRGSVQFHQATSAASQSADFTLNYQEDAYFTIADGDHYACRLYMIAAQADGSTGYWEYIIVIKREGSTTSLSGSPVFTTVVEDTNIGTPTWAVTADDTNDRLSIKVTPANTTATQWSVRCDYVSIKY